MKIIKFMMLGIFLSIATAYGMNEQVSQPEGLRGPIPGAVASPDDITSAINNKKETIEDYKPGDLIIIRRSDGSLKYAQVLSNEDLLVRPGLRPIPGAIFVVANHVPNSYEILTRFVDLNGIIGLIPETCSICRESDFNIEEAGQGKVRLPCGHAFHADCIVHWLLRDPQELDNLGEEQRAERGVPLKRNCPVCHTEIVVKGDEESEQTWVVRILSELYKYQANKNALSKTSYANINTDYENAVNRFQDAQGYIIDEDSKPRIWQNVVVSTIRKLSESQRLNQPLPNSLDELTLLQREKLNTFASGQMMTSAEAFPQVIQMARDGNKSFSEMLDVLNRENQ